MGVFPNPSQQASGNCWKYGGFACLGCGCLVVVLFAIITALLVSRPEFKQVAATTRSVAAAVERMQKIHKALGKYAHDRGQYPDSLNDLVPTYLSAEDIRPTNEEGGPSFQYFKPPSSAGDDFVVLVYEIENPVAPGQAPGIRYELTKAGRLRTGRSSNPAKPESP